MDKDRCKMANRILNLTMEIIYLLTGEQYTVIKTSSECVTPRKHGHVSQGWGKTESPIVKSPPNSLIRNKSNAQKILKLTNKIIELLTKEVAVRYQDVAVYFSMEEWEYLEEHKDLYKDVMMENHQKLTSPDESSKQHKPNRCPSPPYSQDCPEEKKIYQGKDLTNIKVEVIVREEETHVSGDQQCKEEKIPTDISSADDCNQGISGRLLISQDSKTTFDDVTQVSSREHSVRPKLPLSSDSDQHSVACSQIKYIPDHGGGQQSGKSGKRVKKQYICSECGKYFKQKSNLLQHQGIHTREKPFSCPVCSKCFKHKSYLVKHQRIHTGENLLSCLECGKRFTQRRSQVEHQRIHTGEKPFDCVECGKCFRTKSNLLKHQRRHKEKSNSSYKGLLHTCV